VTIDRESHHFLYISRPPVLTCPHSISTMASVDGAGLLGDLANGNLPDYSDPSVALEMFAKHNIQLNNGLNLGPYVLG